MIIPKAGKAYWAVVTRHPVFPIIHGEHYGVTVAEAPTDRLNVVWRTEAEAVAHLATLPQSYDSGERIYWEVACVKHTGDLRSWIDC